MNGLGKACYCMNGFNAVCMVLLHPVCAGVSFFHFSRHWTCSVFTGATEFHRVILFL